jgi:flavin-dependent dehydrogenase
MHWCLREAARESPRLLHRDSDLGHSGFRHPGRKSLTQAPKLERVVTPRANFDTEVCVIGGGPAGAALACRLATLGHSVVVVERDRFPRSHVGESVSPGVWPLLEALGAHTAVEAACFPCAVEARVRWGAPETRRLTTAEPGINVDRGVFDQILLSRAKAAGAKILQPARARVPTAVPGGWEVPVATADGPHTVRARFVADASGRAHVLGGHRKRTSPRTVALHALWSGVESYAGQTRVEAQPESWLWGAHMPGGAFRAMAFVEPEMVRRRPPVVGRIEHLYRELLADSSFFSHLLAGDARLESDVSVCDATCYVDDSPIDMTTIKVGEAGFAIDPLSASGVQTAIQMGVGAGVAIGSILSQDGDSDAAITYFREHQCHAVERHEWLTARSYRMCTAYAAKPFWRRRSAWAPEPPLADPPVSLEDLLGQPVSLSHRSVLMPTPCVVGDRVEFRRALCHPMLSRPVAYLGDNELAPLLDCLRADRTLREVVEEWTRSIPPSAAYAIARWLADNGLLAPVSAKVAHRRQPL